MTQTSRPRQNPGDLGPVSHRAVAAQRLALSAWRSAVDNVVEGHTWIAEQQAQVPSADSTTASAASQHGPPTSMMARA